MANPQVENGRTEIANELIDALCKTYLNSNESRILWTILRKTYGWHRKTDAISYSQFEAATSIDRRHVGRTIDRLIKRDIIYSTSAGERKMSEYGLQKNYEIWKPSPEESVTNRGDRFKKANTNTNNKSDINIGGNKSNKQKQGEIFELPDWIKKDTWESYLEMRKKIKKPATEKAKTLIARELSKLKTSGFDPDLVLEQSIMNCWQGVFPLKSQFGGNNNVNAVNQKPSPRQLPKVYTRPEDIRTGNQAGVIHPTTNP